MFREELAFCRKGKMCLWSQGKRAACAATESCGWEEKWEGRSRRRRNERRGYGGGLRSVEKIYSLRKVVVGEKKWEEEKWWLGRSGRRRIGY